MAFEQLATDGSFFFNVGGTCGGSDGIVLLNGGVLMDGHYDCNNAINASFTRDPDLTGPFRDHTTTPAGLQFSIS